MSMRQLSLGDKKLRGIPRRMRSLQRWSESFFYKFPSISDEDISYGYWNMKIPVSLSLVQGKQTNKTIKSSCAQALIDAAYNIYQLKPNDKSDIRVTCIIALPDMFSSEICLFTSEDYFKLHTQTGISYLGELSLLKDRSLVREWNLNLPKGFQR